MRQDVRTPIPGEGEVNSCKKCGTPKRFHKKCGNCHPFTDVKAYRKNYWDTKYSDLRRVRTGAGKRIKLDITVTGETPKERKASYRKGYRKLRRLEESVAASARYYRNHDLSKEKSRIRGKLWRSKPEAKIRTSSYDHLRRAQKLSSKIQITHEEIVELKTSSAFCAYCLVAWRAGDMKTLDHILPLSKGGCHTVNNLCVCCKSCNSSKHKATLEEWIVRKGLLGKPPPGAIEICSKH